jgi:cation diffusion facilitator CzcD-associated flavoprotein CzcO
MQNGEEAVADFIVTACGVLHHPRYPDIEGLDDFQGPIFHSARWDHSVPLESKRIAVIGTGSTGVQIVGELADVASNLLHFSRTPQWIFPMPNWKFSRFSRWVMARWPAVNRAAYAWYQGTFARFFSHAPVHEGWQRSLTVWICRRHLKAVRDPQLRAKLTPSYEPMCKRLIMSNNFYRAVQKDNVEVMTEAIERIEPAGIVTADSGLHPVDVIVLATGFHAHAYFRPMNVIGEHGRTLDDVWPAEPVAYRTVALPGFPNFFMMIGPNSPLGNVSLVDVADTLTDYIMQWLRLYMESAYDAAAPSEEATEAFNAEVREAFPGETAWATGGCNSWYIGEEGVPAIWPWTKAQFDRMLRTPRVEDFNLTRAPERAGYSGSAVR